VTRPLPRDLAASPANIGNWLLEVQALRRILIEVTDEPALGKVRDTLSYHSAASIS
jgi:hypothetical protein